MSDSFSYPEQTATDTATPGKNPERKIKQYIYPALNETNQNHNFFLYFLSFFKQEQVNFFANGVETNEETFQETDRYVPMWVRLASPFLRRYL